MTESGTGFLLVVSPSGNVRPGTYTLHLSLPSSRGVLGSVLSTVGLGDGDAIPLFDGPVSIGLMILNSDQAAYQVGGTGVFSLSLVDASLQPLCNQDVTVTVTKPDGSKATLSTMDGTITAQKNCLLATLSDAPDYGFSVPFATTGTYRIAVQAGDISSAESV